MNMLMVNFFIKVLKKQLKILESIFNYKARVRYSEILFSPELKFSIPGKENSFLGKLDSYLSSSFGFFKLIARQESFYLEKTVPNKFKILLIGL